MSLVQRFRSSLPKIASDIVSIKIEKNVLDSKTLQPAIEQQKRLTGITLKNNFVERDRGYDGVKEVLGT